jgi:hypothetical protein
VRGREEEGEVACGWVLERRWPWGGNTLPHLSKKNQERI